MDMETSSAPAVQTLNLGVIGNGSVAALIDGQGTFVWGCLPRFDSDPVFCSLLMGGARETYGYFALRLENLARAEQSYLKNTAILTTTLYDANGGIVEITDFAPRYNHYGRTFHPLMMIRKVRCLAGLPRITVELCPATDKGAAPAPQFLGSNHIRFAGQEQPLRLTTDGPASLIFRQIPFVLQKDLTMILAPDEPLQESPTHVGLSLFENTKAYWQAWTRNLALPAQWQDVVIRSAITLKLCCYEETGGIVAALTTSIPEYEGTGRTWDYRYCWLRDAFFVVQALNRLGAMETMERYIAYVKNIVASTGKAPLQPLYGISYEKELPETQAEHLKGYRDNGPVRFGNDAYRQIQNDSYGSVILALAQRFFDERLDHTGDTELFALLEDLGERAVNAWDKPDAGLWEYRTRMAVHTYSAAMCWAACDRLGRIARKIGRPDRAAAWKAVAETIRESLLKNAWNEERQTFASTFGGKDVDASLLLLPEIGLIDVNDRRFCGTLAAVENDLKAGCVLFRYREPDDFGAPETSFNICSLWYARTLKRVGRDEEARAVFENILARLNTVGVLSEGSHPLTGEMWGNYPQTYSMVGLIQTALQLSDSWETVI